MGRLVPRHLFRRLLAAREYVDEHHADGLALADIAARAAISPYHFLRLFNQAFGVTPLEYLRRVRLDRARVLLARGGTSVTETCFEVGYQSVGSFSSLFARRFGSSPDAYRRRMRRFVAVPRARLFIPCCYLDRFAA